jgi:peroxiredoxin
VIAAGKSDNLPRMKQEIGLPVPSFSLPRLEGAGSVSLQDYLDGRRGALVVFWSGVCTHCVRYDDYFNTFSRRQPLLGFLAIASRMNEPGTQMLSAVRARGLTFPILVDEGGKVARLWYAQQTPRCYLLGPDRTLHYRGAIDNFRMPGDPEYTAWLEPAIASFLAGEPIARPETASFGCAIETVYYQIPRQL